MGRYDVTPLTFRVDTDVAADSVFKFQDTLTSRAELGDLAAAFRNDVIAVIGLGGTGAYLLDFLKATGNSGEVRLEFKDAQSAGQMRPEDGADDYKYRYIIMPMRI